MEIIKRIKYLRLSPLERHFVDLFNSVTKIQETDDMICYYICEELVFEYDITNNLFRFNPVYWHIIYDKYYTYLYLNNKINHHRILQQIINSTFGFYPKFTCVGLSKLT